MRFLLTIVVILGFSAKPLWASPFFWGVANAAFQVEGTPGESDWKDWTHTPGRIFDGSNADRVSDFWDLYDTDFALAQELGANSFRISIAWERIEPEKNQWNLEALKHYEKIIAAMRARGLEPIVTLHHFVLPQWVAQEGGVLAPQFPQYFSAYAEKVVTFFSQSAAPVHFWITFNEPNVLANNGYVSGDWPPGQKGRFDLALKAQFQMAKAHIEASRVMRTADSHIHIGVAQHWKVFQPSTQHFLDRRVSNLLDFIFNRYFVNAILTGNPCSKIIGIFCPSFPLKKNENTLDFLGINYYGRGLVKFSSHAPYFSLEEGPGMKSDMGWEVYPQGLYLALKDVAQYKRPILVTENGIADRTDSLRPNFLRDHISFLKRAQKEGINVVGYLHWSLTDNFEWAKGLSPKFGLVDVDYDTLLRTKRPSFEEYKKIIQNN